MDLLPLLKKSLHRKSWVKSGDRLILGVSGGVDSMVLMDLMDRLRKTSELRLVVAHLNHNLRGRESEGDARCVEREARRRELAFEMKKLPRGALEKKGGNFQEEARNQRYRFFASVAKKYKAEIILTAHQADDQVETFLMRLLRGAGAEGLKGIVPELILRLSFFSKRSGSLRVIRPLLPFDRRSLLRYAQERKLIWRDDRSNRDETYLRNRIRRHLMVEMKKINPRVVEGICQTLNLLQKEDEFLDDWASRHLKSRFVSKKDSSTLALPWLHRQPEALRYRIYRKMLERSKGDLAGIYRSHLSAIDEMVLRKNRKARISLPRGWGATLAKNRLLLKKWRSGTALQKRGFFY